MKKKKYIILLIILLSVVFLIFILNKIIDKKEIYNSKKIIKFIERKDETSVSKNDLLQIGNTEQFYVIDTNEKETILMAKYNLYVGAIYSKYDEKNDKYYLENTITSEDEGYGLQNEKAIGNRSKNEKTIGGVYFSSKQYWIDNNKKLLPKYGTVEKYNEYWTKNDIYDDLYNGSQSSDYSIAYYIKNYVNTLNSIGLKDVQGRILSLEELDNLGCHMINLKVDCDDAPEYVKYSSYWISTAFNNTFIYTNNYDLIPYNGNNRRVDYMGSYLEYESELPTYSLAGVRPIIIIPTSILKN